LEEQEGDWSLTLRRILESRLWGWEVDWNWFWIIQIQFGLHKTCAL